jgi:long-chain acyl-CoA synthetase
VEIGISAHARARPDATAIVDGDARWTFAELDVRADRAAHALRSVGVGPDGRVAVALANHATHFEVICGAARLGAEVVPVPWRAKQDEVRYMVSDSGAVVLVAEPDAREQTEGLRAVHLGAEWDALVRDAPGGPPSGSIDPAPLLIRYYTSGTTGRPKAVERARGDTDAYLRSIHQQLEIYDVAARDEVHLVAGVLYHSAPLGFSLFALQLGQKVVVMRRFDAASFLDLTERERVTWTFMAPVHFTRILSLGAEAVGARDLSSIRRLIHAGAPCPPQVKRRIIDLFPPGSVWEFYGMTEGRATIIPPEEWLRKPGSVGRPIEGTRVRILGADGVEVEAGTVGTVYVSLPGNARFAYAGAPDKTAAAWLGDFYTVGDMGYVDTDGYLFLTDRAQDLIISGGSNVYPAEVEAMLHTHPAVADVAVIGVPDDEWGERVHAIVEARATVRADELLAFMRDRLSHYKCPRSIEFVERLPREPNGKIRKRALREPYWRDRSSRI